MAYRDAWSILVLNIYHRLEMVSLMTEFRQQAAALVEAGRQLYARGMVPATSGNFSARLSDGTLAITVSGAHKGKLKESDIMRVDAEGQTLDGRQPSAETLLHVGIYQCRADAHVVLHPHSIPATVLSRLCEDSLLLQNYELLKAFSGIDSHQTSLVVPVLDNDQNIARLAAKAESRLKSTRPVYGYLIRGHGFYTWGKEISAALRHVEAFEFLFECELLMRRYQS